MLVEICHDSYHDHGAVRNTSDSMCYISSTSVFRVMHMFASVVDLPLYPDCSTYDSTVWLEDPVNCYAFYICDSHQKLYHLSCMPLFWSQLHMTCVTFGLPECADYGDIEYNTTLPETGKAHPAAMFHYCISDVLCLITFVRVLLYIPKYCLTYQ